jgi:hypothetical protein
MHNKPRLEIIVTGAPVELGVYITVVATFASDLDASLKFDGQTAFLLKDKGLVTMCYDEDSGKFNFLRCKDGALAVTATVETPGDPFFIRGQVLASPGNSVDVFTSVVPASTVRKLTQLWVTATNDGYFSLEADGLQVAYGRIDNVLHNAKFNFNPSRPIVSGVSLVLKFISDTEPTMTCSVTGFLSGYDVVV